jgi:hypothetical protein
MSFQMLSASDRVGCGVECDGARLAIPASRPVAALVELSFRTRPNHPICGDDALCYDSIRYRISILSGGGSCWGGFGASNWLNNTITYGVDAQSAIAYLEGTVAKDHGQVVTDRPIGVLSTGL